MCAIMAKDIRIELTESEYEQATTVKERHSLTWKDLLLRDVTVPAEKTLQTTSGEQVETLVHSTGDGPHQHPVLFSKQDFDYEYVVESDYTDLSIEEFRGFFEDLAKFAHIDENSGSFSIVQSADHTWTGFGVENMLAALGTNPSNRQQPANHHREELMWVGPGGKGHNATIVTAQPHTKKDWIERVQVAFVTDGIPVAPEFSVGLERLPVEFSTVSPWSVTEETEGFGNRPLELDVEDFIDEHTPDGQVDRLQISNIWSDRLGRHPGVSDEISHEANEEIEAQESLLVDVTKPFFESEGIAEYRIAEARVQSFTLNQITAHILNIRAEPVL